MSLHGSKALVYSREFYRRGGTSQSWVFLLFAFKKFNFKVKKVVKSSMQGSPTPSPLDVLRCHQYKAKTRLIRKFKHLGRMARGFVSEKLEFQLKRFAH
jgi:hypothetical protein